MTTLAHKERTLHAAARIRKQARRATPVVLCTATLIGLTLVAGISAPGAADAAGAIRRFVSTDGSDAWSGTRARQTRRKVTGRLRRLPAPATPSVR